ncbi:MAG: hypothetical protein FWG02_03645 [Holophagaceae bacterium]|nr:hypothetical protein [Holophagaceae bacterium]
MFNTSHTKFFPTIALSAIVFLPPPVVAQDTLIRTDRGVQHVITIHTQATDSWLLLYIGPRSEQQYNTLMATIQKGYLAQMEILLRQLQPSSEEHARFVNEFGLLQDSLWAIAVPLGNNRFRCSAQGNELPTNEDLQIALENAGIKSPIRQLTDFLKQNPDHLDARMELLSHLSRFAEERTRQALLLDVKTAAQLTREEQSFSAILRKLTIDTELLSDKKLDSEQDTEIWGQYYKELRTLFSNDDWRLISFPRSQFLIPVDGCSPMMVQLYRQNIPKVEAFLEEYPSNTQIWQTYGHMLSITGQNPRRALLDRIVPSPDMRWPVPEVLDLLLMEDREKGNWAYIAETLMGYWPRLRSYTLGFHFAPQAANGFINSSWSTELKPVLESLIKTNRIEDAERVISDTAKVPRFKDIQRRAAELAMNLGRQDLQTKWLAMHIPEKTGYDIDDVYEMFGQFPPSPRLVIINGKDDSNKLVDALLRQSRIVDWRVMRTDLGMELSYYLREREGWHEFETRWALFYNDSMLNHGQGLPTEEALIQALESSRAQIPAVALRRFISEHPNQFEAKESLLRELKRIAVQKTLDKLGAGAGIDLTLKLSDADDQAIWSEYVAMYRQLLPYYLERGRPAWNWQGSPCDSAFFVHSNIMENFAHYFLPQIEVALQRQPSNSLLWSAWASLYDLDDRRNLIKFLDSLEFSPLADRWTANIPPNARTLVARYRQRSNWQRVIELLERIWDVRQVGFELHSTYFIRYIWTQDIQPLLEAYLRLGKNSEANELIRFWSQSPVWQEIKQSAVDIAKKCEKETLAEQWGRL